MTTSVTNTQIISLSTFLVCCCYCFAAKDSITTGEMINDGSGYLESPEKKFQMGFFQPEKTSELKRYVGIWYSMDPKIVVWVANRDKPVLDSTGVLTVSEDGSAKLLTGTQTEYFSTNTVGASSRTLKMLDSGNAVLIDVKSGRILWQSFDTPTDTFLPRMIMVANLNLRSWKSEKDPASGEFIFKLDSDSNRYSILNGSTLPLWRSRSQSVDSFDSFDDKQILSQAVNLLTNTTKQKPSNIAKQKGKINFVNPTPYYERDVVRLVMNYTGRIQYLRWEQEEKEWVLDWEEPKDKCNVFRVCGPLGMCTLDKDPLCSCLPGFEPVSPDDYMSGDYTAGCKRCLETCDRTKEMFLNITMISIDDATLSFIKSNNESVCINECLRKCDCLAYSYRSQNKGGIFNESRNGTQGCWFWDSAPNNLRGNGAHNISFRVPNHLKDAGQKLASVKLLPVFVVFVSALVLSLLCVIGYISYKRFVNRRENDQRNIEFEPPNSTGTHINEILDLDHLRDDREGIDVPYFDLESIIAATDDFSEKNRLGQGGCGPVYKAT